MQKFWSNGKLLLSGEYAVLDGAKALALPTRYGQSLEVERIDDPTIHWVSFDHENQIWFQANFKMSLLFEESTMIGRDDAIFERVLQILRALRTMTPNLFNRKSGYKITTRLDFPSNWGLGSSSTLINNLSQWAQVDAYKLLALTFEGSGYDIACSQNDQPITYQLTASGRSIQKVVFDPEFKSHLYFVFLNKKKNSREAIKQYRQHKQTESSLLKISEITDALIVATKIDEFCSLLDKHEYLISELTKQTTIKESLFNDFEGSLKSLGGWGGDFILAASSSDPREYFVAKGYTIIIPFSEMVLK